MSKFTKRISKSVNIEGNALIIGDGFGFLSDILSLFPSVFVVLNESERVKAKNVIYRENIDNLHLLPTINVVFVDLKFKNRLNDFENIMTTVKPIFLIEGNDVIDREWTIKFYQLGYRAVDQQGYFHQWKKTQ